MQIKIREIQHFLYCAHRWGLIEINQAWAENYFVVKGNMLHERVHDPDRAYSLRGKKVLTGVQVYLDLPHCGLYGVVDCLEATPSPSGTLLADGRKYVLCIVEYKPSMPKDKPYNRDDAMQVFAQKLCVDSIFNCQCKAELFYAKEKKRVPLPFDAEYELYHESLDEALNAICSFKESGIIPPIAKGQNCCGCSLKELCMPASVREMTTRQRIQKYLEAME